MSYPNSGCCHQEKSVYRNSDCCNQERIGYRNSNCCSQESYAYSGCCRQERRSYLYVYGLIGFFAVLLAFAVGLILGAVYYETILPVVAAIIAFVAALAAVGIGIWFFTRRRCC